MPDQPEAPATPWPDWLADLTPEDRVREIVSLHAHWCHGADGRCSGSEAVDLLLRLLDEARQQGWESAFTEAIDVQQKRLDAAFGVGRRAERNGAADLGDLRQRIDVALGESMDRCSRCKVCDTQLDAIMAVLAAEPSPVPSAAETQLAVAVPALRRLAADGDMTGGGPLIEELAERQRLAAGTLETIVQLSQVPEQPEPLTHFTTAGQSRLAADNFPVCEAPHWAIVSPYVRQVTCDDCLTWLGSAVGNLTRALANAAATIERRDADLAEPDPEPLPPGFFGRVELPGFRHYTGWITQDGADRIVSDWDGNVLAEYQPGPNCLTIHLPTPQKRPEPQKAIAAGPQRDEDDDPDDSYGMPF